MFVIVLLPLITKPKNINKLSNFNTTSPTESIELWEQMFIYIDFCFYHVYFNVMVTQAHTAYTVSAVSLYCVHSPKLYPVPGKQTYIGLIHRLWNDPRILFSQWFSVQAGCKRHLHRIQNAEMEQSQIYTEIFVKSSTSATHSHCGEPANSILLAGSSHICRSHGCNQITSVSLAPQARRT